MNESQSLYRQHLLDQLVILDKSHREAAAPILKRLYELEAEWPPALTLFDIQGLPPGLMAEVLKGIKP